MRTQTGGTIMYHALGLLQDDYMSQLAEYLAGKE